MPREKQKPKSRDRKTSLDAEPIILNSEPLDVIGSRVLRRAPSHHFRILRPTDLVVLDVLGYGLELRVDNDGPALHPLRGNARLEVRYTFQHLLEAGEIDNETPPHVHNVPIPCRAAFGSRLVFAVASNERIGYSVEGVLAAISRLPLMVAPLAKPKVLSRRFLPGSLSELVTAAILPGGLQLYRANGGLVLAAARQGSVPELSGARRLISAASGLRTARVMLSTERAIDLSGVELQAGKGGFGRFAVKPDWVRPWRARPRKPRANETAIETPFRLILSPSKLGGFAHATSPQAVMPHPDRADDPERIELWHSRLGVRRVDREGGVEIDEVTNPQKVVRAIWTRDKDNPAPSGGNVFTVTTVSREDREALVRQSADPLIAPPQPVDVDRLYLTALGSWMELHGRWNHTPYSSLKHHAIEAWDHEATSGRDNYVRMVYPYYLFPFGHRCSLVKITERKIKQNVGPEARLYQRKFITVQQPVRTFDDRRMPFRQVRLRPLVTPDLDFEPPGIVDAEGARVLAGSVTNAEAGVPDLEALDINLEDLFWPHIDNLKYRFVLDCLDHDGRRVILRAPLLAVSAELGTAAQKKPIQTAYTSDFESPIAGDGQMLAVASSTLPGDTAYETVELRFNGDPGAPGSQISTPHLHNAQIVVPAMKHLAPSSNPVTVKYASKYISDGFAGTNATAQVLLELEKNDVAIEFGGGTDKAGGFIQPDLPVRGLSRTIGIVGDIVSVSLPNPATAFNPTEFLKGALPKLFGLFELTDILAIAGLDKAPKFLTDQLDKIAALVADLEDLSRAIDNAVIRLGNDAANAPTAVLRAQAAEAKAAIEAVQSSFANLVQQFNDALDSLMALDSVSDLPTVKAAVSGILNSIASLVTSLQTTARALPLPPTTKAELERLTGALSPLLDAGEILSTIQAIADFVNGFDPSGMAVRARFEWRPELTNFPDVSDEDDALFFVPKDGFVLSVEARASASDGVGADVLAELRDFGLNLFPGTPLVKIRFDRLAFRAASGRKSEVDIVFTGLEWQGILGFIAKLQELIPFDGFSDPPYVDVSPEGLTAGFDLALPNLSVGVFSLENISLGADVRVPFLGDALTFGFNFCTREKPFRLTYMAIGGGGFVGLRLSPKGMVLLEMSFELGASLSINLGVASGSVSVMIGIYMRLESEAGSLTGYFRIRGEVDVLGLISASITLELSLAYEFDTGKMVGRASIEIEVEIFLFSFSVTVSCERRLAGSNGDPTLSQVLGLPDDGLPVVDTPAAWSDYCSAFAEA